MLRVMVWDDTEKVPIHAKAEIWFRGHGSWWLKPELQHGSTAATLGRRPIGMKDVLFIYPDGRDGKEIAVSVVMTEEMNTEGSVRDSLVINIRDRELEVFGPPLKAATGNIRQIVKRR